MLRIHLMPALRPFADGAAVVELASVPTVHALFEALSTRFPALRPHLEQGVAVAMNGAILQDQLFARLPSEGEVHLMPALAGG